MDLLQLRETAIFEALTKIKALRFVVIGGYAVNAYTLPRFSVDCDIVIENRAELGKIQSILFGLAYSKREPVKTTNFDYFERYEKELENKFKVSFDVLIKEVLDRQTNAVISADWIFSNSEIRKLRGKTIFEDLKLRIIDIDALFVMKMISCRSTDIRDLFMLAPNIKDGDFIRKEVSLLCDFDDRFKKVREKIISREFKDGLQGIYGLIDQNMFEKSINSILALEDKK